MPLHFTGKSFLVYVSISILFDGSLLAHHIDSPRQTKDVRNVFFCGTFDIRTNKLFFLSDLATIWLEESVERKAVTSY